ncbi:glycosyltransferase family 4 protein [Jaapia argillacea MUCL 33604]|uniref:Alpha-1,3/1,6-mannosyltransferase ALG2 n=1 Tax=Jaapia argillacea MUCL 33604 TaxID=933084 RepID=A0A067PY56_9AGAM|nr:glycosyltransferase family 4 protein [Jaapia argillacea MUCL 33604]
MITNHPLKVAFIHPDLGIGGAERLVVDAALGLQKLGHSVDIYTSHHDRNHCFEETRDGTLNILCIKPPFPRSLFGLLHIICAHLRQLHLTYFLIHSKPKYDVYFVDQLSTCIPFIRYSTEKRVVFYCHFPDKLLAAGEYVDGAAGNRPGSLLKRIYRMPMDWWEERTTREADVILANSSFTSRVFRSHFKSISYEPRIVYPGINISAYEQGFDANNSDVQQVLSSRPTFLSLNRFEKKKNARLAIEAFTLFKQKRPTGLDKVRLVLAGGYDPRLEDNVSLLTTLLDCAKKRSLTFTVIQPSTSRVALSLDLKNQADPDIVFLLNFTTGQRSALLSSPSTLALLYTPTNEHFGIGPIEGMISGLPILACNSGGPTESVVDEPHASRTGWLRPPVPEVWADALVEITSMSKQQREQLSERARARAKGSFGMEAMAKGIESALEEAVDMGDVPENFWVGLWEPLKMFCMIALVTLIAKWYASYTKGSR